MAILSVLVAVLVGSLMSNHNSRPQMMGKRIGRWVCLHRTASASRRHHTDGNHVRTACRLRRRPSEFLRLLIHQTVVSAEVSLTGECREEFEWVGVRFVALTSIGVHYHRSSLRFHS